MKTTPAAARILVATDDAEDAQQIVTHLRSEFADVRSSTAADDAVGDFEACRPDVLVLAFDTLEKAQNYYLGLYRLSAGTLRGAHRTVVLCSKAEVRAAYELCKRDYFDDYVLYWPQAFDGTRLFMSVWNACRHLRAPSDEMPRHGEFLVHASHLADIERIVADPVESTSGELRERIEPSLIGTRLVAEAVRKLRPLVLVVEDDEFARQLVQKALDPERWEVALVSDGAAAMRHMRFSRPDVILMDVRLPGEDGVALTRRLKATSHLADIPVVMMTGDARRETLLSSMEAGATAFVVKPIARAALEAKLAKIIPRT